MNGYVLYHGPSRLDGRRIVAIATMRSHNAKTGPMVQTWIMVPRLSPLTAARRGREESVCGDCPGRLANHGWCYVRLEQAVSEVYDAYRRGVYPRLTPSQYRVFDNQAIRLGAYGDPAAVPPSVWWELDRHASLVTGYTHQWRVPELQTYQRWCMASCESESQATTARRMGWRTYRVVEDLDSATLAADEKVCPAHRGARCIDCGQCSGGKGHSIVTQVHGSPPILAQFRRAGHV